MGLALSKSVFLHRILIFSQKVRFFIEYYVDLGKMDPALPTRTSIIKAIMANKMETMYPDKPVRKLSLLKWSKASPKKLQWEFMATLIYFYEVL